MLEVLRQLRHITVCFLRHIGSDTRKHGTYTPKDLLPPTFTFLFPDSAAYIQATG
jgi:hypothetical protein